jgi:hypothetical protein
MREDLIFTACKDEAKQIENNDVIERILERVEIMHYEYILLAW